MKEAGFGFKISLPCSLYLKDMFKQDAICFVNAIGYYKIKKSFHFFFNKNVYRAHGSRI